ncbi:ComF family protein [Luteibacter rhizovicinus]|uniref:ComF family protein n=1 Tax=Luteibacter rhizovicinus TaxID=242606 RepID=A0A4R3YJ17_9GAMM|nr:ComF family protein [Luteibacter rhizovicinus]TCV92417.1 ComF family protein [Luteibacter rhizovicinus]
MLNKPFRILERLILPPRCVLCGDSGDGVVDMCAACAAQLPRNDSRCMRCALPLAYTVELCGQCQRRPPPWTAAWVPFVYAWPLDVLESRFKFGGSLACGRVLAGRWCEAAPSTERPQLIVPVPLHTARLRRRGYNQALELARPLARALDLPLRHDLLARRRATDAQTELDAVARRKNVHGAFRLRAAPGVEHVALVDDVMTTGATLAECARVLCRAGVARVDVWALARAPLPGH